MVKVVKEKFNYGTNDVSIYQYLSVHIVHADYYGDVKYIKPLIENGKEYTILKRTYFNKNDLCCGVTFIRNDFLEWLDAIDCVVYDSYDVMFIKLDTERKRFDWEMYWNV